MRWWYAYVPWRGWSWWLIGKFQATETEVREAFGDSASIEANGVIRFRHRPAATPAIIRRPTRR